MCSQKRIFYSVWDGLFTLCFRPIPLELEVERAMFGPYVEPEHDEGVWHERIRHGGKFRNFWI